MKQVNQVLQTNDYNKFYLVEGNRNINTLHVKRLQESFSRKYLFAPILVNERMEIIDGQHRFTGAMELGLPINFIVVNGYGLNEVQMLNTNMKNWKKEDYLNGYCDLGYPEYLKFRNFTKQFPLFGITVCELLLKNGHDKKISIDGKDVEAREFIEGNFKISNYEKAVENAKRLIEIKSFYEGYTRRSFVMAMLAMFKNNDFDFDVFIKKLKMQPTSLQDCTNTSQYKMLIEDIYNYKSREKVNLRF